MKPVVVTTKPQRWSCDIEAADNPNSRYSWTSISLMNLFYILLLQLNLQTHFHPSHPALTDTPSPVSGLSELVAVGVYNVMVFIYCPGGVLSGNTTR